MRKRILSRIKMLLVWLLAYLMRMFLNVYKDGDIFKIGKLLYV
jgi:hypothetical protein